MINSLCMNQVCVKGMTVGKFQRQAIKIPPLSVDNDGLSKTARTMEMLDNV